MANNVGHEPPGSFGPVRVRRPELIRPADKRRDFTTREAQRRLQEKERPRWALIAYGVFLAACAVIFCITYTTYAFSKYRGVVLPGVHVDGVSLAGLTTNQARNALSFQLYNHNFVPIRLTSGSKSWEPNYQQIGYTPNINTTVKQAQLVGRHESFVEQLIDRLPLHPSHAVQLQFAFQPRKLRAYFLLPGSRGVAQSVFAREQDAGLHMNATTNRVDLIHSRPGQYLDMPSSIAAVQSALGSLTTQTVPLPVIHVRPTISDSYARGIQARVENFLGNPPVIAIGKRVFPTTRATFSPMFAFRNKVGKQRAVIEMIVDPTKVSNYVAQLASQMDRAAQNARVRFSGSSVVLLRPRRTGRTLDQAGALAKLLPVLKNLQPRARLHLQVTTTQPSIDLQNPASLGITRLLAVGSTSFTGAGPTRLADIRAIAARLNDDLLPPNQEISFNSLTGTAWLDRTYNDREREVGGKLVPARGGAMQQMATTFLRALYDTGLKVIERHPHTYRLPWYEPPVGLDAFVSPSNGEDLRFFNNSGKYLLIEASVQPIREELDIYVYGPHLGWKVQVDTLGKIQKVYPHGPPLVRQDPSLSEGQVVQTAWAHDGADTVVQRTITFPNGNVQTDQISSHYQPWRAIRAEGRPAPTPRPTGAPKSTNTPTPQSTGTPTSTPQPSPTSSPTPTPTFNH